MNYKIMNLKEFMPTTLQALAMIEIEIKACKKEGIKVIKIIHGYGSNGIGGEIKRALPLWSKKAIKNGLISAFVKGELWLTENDVIDKIKKICPEILGDIELYHANAGVSVILI